MAASVKDGWVDNVGVRLHYLDSGAEADPSLTPLVIVPGSLGAAEEFQREIDALAPRRVIAMSLRGRGQSDAPVTGYSFVEQVRDVEAVIDASGVLDFCLMGYSMGTAFALGYTILHPTRVTGLIVGDYPARYPALSTEWKPRAAALKGDRIKPHVIEGIQRESAELPLWDDLDAISAPAMLMRGDQEDALLKPEQVDQYLAHLDPAIAVVMPGSGHRLWEPDFDRYVRAIKLFLEALDKGIGGEEDP